MKLRRFEFGISRVTPDAIQVYARRGDGQLYFKNYPHELADLLDVAECDFRITQADWWTADPLPNATGLSLCWERGPRLHISGEAAITLDALEDAKADLIVSMNTIQQTTRDHIASYLQDHSEARHLDAPILDVLPKFQNSASRESAKRALRAGTGALREGRTVVVHCLMGIHRSVSLGAVALARANLIPSPREAFLEIQSRRHIASWIPETVEWLSRLEEQHETS